MKRNKIIKYYIRASYPNYFYLHLFSEYNREIFEKEKEPEGNKPGTLIYYTQNSEQAQEYAPKWYDLYYLLQRQEEEAISYIDLLLEEQDGIEDNRDILENLRNRFYDECRDYVKKHPLYENAQVISPVSSKNYDVFEISHKGVMLLDLVRAGYAVPDFSLLSAKVFQYPLKNEEADEVHKKYLSEAIRNLEIMTSCTLGSSEKPLVMALRSTMPQYIPGLMPTLLNAGVSKKAFLGLKANYGELMAQRIYGDNLDNIYKMLFEKENPYKHLLSEHPQNTEILREYIHLSEESIESHPQGKRILEDAFYQLCALFKYIYIFYRNNRDLLATFMQGKIAYPSLILQRMVWTIGNHNSYPGVLYSRHSRTGLGVQIESYRDIFGEDIMTGNISSEDFEYFDRAQIKDLFPAVYHFDPLLSKLEKRVKSPVTIEFGAESGLNISLFAVLQINESELTGRAALLSSIDLYEKGYIGIERVSELIKPYHRRQIFSERIDDSSLQNLIYFGKGLNILPRSASSALLFFSAGKALEAKRAGNKVCLCKDKFVPEDTIILNEMDAILSMHPAAIHVVTACRGFGIPAFLNLESYGIRWITEKDGICIENEEGMRIGEGEWITLSSKNSAIYKGKANFQAARFYQYLHGENFPMNPKEEKVFIGMKEAYEKYSALISSMQIPDIVGLDQLVRLIRNDLQEKPDEAKKFVNSWFDFNAEKYVEQVMESAMGSHQDQFRAFDLLTTERKIKFFKLSYIFCSSLKRSGFEAGSFMLGRFLAIPQPCTFWQAFDSVSIAFMLNEYVLYEKYLHVLYEVGEQQISKAREKILGQDIQRIHFDIRGIHHLLPLKLIKPNWNEIKQSLKKLHNLQKETALLIKHLELSYRQAGYFEKPWSINPLRECCEKEGIDLPGEEDW